MAANAIDGIEERPSKRLRALNKLTPFRVAVESRFPTVLRRSVLQSLELRHYGGGVPSKHVIVTPLPR